LQITSKVRDKLAYFKFDAGWQSDSSGVRESTPERISANDQEFVLANLSYGEENRAKSDIFTC
jgi:hypothetical protein